ncbi:MAG: MMPL family transporter [Gammaproteobacteria bacterium]|nr:MMPL family transporter [Gammaproteobacteria bacterium]
MVKTYAEIILKMRWLVVLITVLIIAAMGYGAQFLSFTNDYRVFFSKENPQLVAFENLQDTYSKNDNVMMVLAPKDGNVFTAKNLKAITWLTELAWQTPYSTRVDSITNFQHTRADGDDLIVENLVYEDDDLTPQRIEDIKQIAINEPLLVNRLVSNSGHVTGINVTIELKGENVTTENPEVVDFVRDLKKEFVQKYPDIDVKLTGIIMMNRAFPEASQYDMQNLVPFMFLVFIIILFFWVKGLSGTLATFFVIVFSIVGAMGLAGWLGIALTPPSFSAIMIIPTMSIAHSVHILMNFLIAIHHGETRREAMIDSLRINMQPVFLTTVTTGIGFLSLNFSDAPPFRDLGNIVAMGVVIAYFLSITFLPAMMMILPVKEQVVETRTSRLMVALAEFVIKRRKVLLLVMGLGILLLLSFIPRNELNDEFTKYFSTEIEFRRDADFASDNLSGLYLVDYSLESGETGGVSSPEFLQRVEAFANWFRDQPEVIHVNVITDIFKRLNRNMHNDEDSWYKLPDQRNLAAQYLLLYEMSLPYGLDLNNQINVDKSSTRMTVMLYNTSTSNVLALEQRAQAWLKDNVPVTMQNEGASPTIMFSHIGFRNIRAMLLGTTIALVLISFILIFALRSFKIGFISLIPNLIPAGMAFGLWGLAVGQVGLALSVVTGMTLGIVVDDTVHFLSKYLRARREKGLDAADATRYAFRTVGLALVATSIVLALGFMVLTQSAFTLNSDMGLMTATTIVFALIADFLLLPPLLMALDKKESKHV